MPARFAKFFRLLLVTAATLPAGLPATAHAFGDVELRAMIRHTPDLTRYGDVGGLWMGRETKYTIDGVGNIQATEHHLARVLDPSWAEEHLSPFRVEYWGMRQSVGVQRVRVYKNQDEFVDLPRESVRYVRSRLSGDSPAYEDARTLEIDFGELEAGDVVEILYERSDRVLGGEYNLRWFNHLYGSNIATVEERVSITAPSALDPWIEQVGTPVRGNLKRKGGFEELFWVTGHLRPFEVEVEESFHSKRSVDEAVPDSSSQLVFSTTDWNYLGVHFGRAWNLFAEEISPELRQKANDVAGKKRGEERARAIEQWVQEDIETLPLNHRHQGLRPRPAAATFAGGSASTIDKTLILMAALRAAGINGSPVLIRTRTEPWRKDLGCPDQLDRFLVRVRLSSDKTIWLDPVDSTTPFAETVGLLFTLPDVDTDFGLIEVPARP